MGNMSNVPISLDYLLGIYVLGTRHVRLIIGIMLSGKIFSRRNAIGTYLVFTRVLTSNGIFGIVNFSSFAPASDISGTNFNIL